MWWMPRATSSPSAPRRTSWPPARWTRTAILYTPRASVASPPSSPSTTAPSRSPRAMPSRAAAPCGTCLWTPPPPTPCV